MEGATQGARRSWDAQGFAVLPQAAPSAAAERLAGELADAVGRLLVRAPGDDHPSLATRHPEAGAGAVDPYMLCGAARDLLLAPPVVAWLRELLADTPMLVDAAEAAAGPPDAGAAEHGPFRDPTYVPLSDPESLVGIAVAVGDALVTVFPGSHHLPVERFSGRYRHVNLERDGEHALAEHRAGLRASLAEAGIEEEPVALHAGDVVLWQADLVHRAVEGAALAGHLAPARAEPWWFAHRPDRAYRVPHGDACFTSRHYALDDLPGAVAAEASPPSPSPTTERGTPDLDVVEHALDRHDDVPDTPAAPPRNRGLMGRVRGAMGRRPPRP